jgi:hypothetical protein
MGQTFLSTQAAHSAVQNQCRIRTPSREEVIIYGCMKRLDENLWHRFLFGTGSIGSVNRFPYDSRRSTI